MLIALDGQLLELKSTVFNLERNFKEIRLQALSNRPLAVQEVRKKKERYKLFYIGKPAMITFK